MVSQIIKFTKKIFIVALNKNKINTNPIKTMDLIVSTKESSNKILSTEPSDKFYRLYCSKCNSNVKKRMTWKKYIYYMSFDSKSKGYHDIETSLVDNKPSKCPFGHPIKIDKVTVISK